MRWGVREGCPARSEQTLDPFDRASFFVFFLLLPIQLINSGASPRPFSISRGVHGQMLALRQ